MKRSYQCGICGTLSLVGVLDTQPLHALPSILLPPGADIRWSYVRVHVCQVCRNTAKQWFKRHKATHYDLRLGKPVRGAAAGAKPWRIPGEYVPDLYAAMLVATMDERNAYLQCWQAPAKPRKAKHD